MSLMHLYIQSREVSPKLSTGRAFVYALDSIISLYSCIRYVSFCTDFAANARNTQAGCPANGLHLDRYTETLNTSLTCSTYRRLGSRMSTSHKEEHEEDLTVCMLADLQNFIS